MMWIVLVILILGVLSFMCLPQFKGYRTDLVTFFGTLSIGGVLPYMADWFTYLNGLDWRLYVPQEYAPLVMIGVAIVYWTLRRITTTPPGVK